MKKIILYLFTIGVFFFTGCQNKYSEQTTGKVNSEIDKLLNLTDDWRYKNLDSAFYYSYLTMRNTKEFFSDSTKLGRAYLNHANLFYLCSRFDSADFYIEKYDSLYIDKPNKKDIGEELFYEYTFLKMLRDIQKIEINTRRLDFEGTSRLLYEDPLVAFNKPIVYWNSRKPTFNKKRYGAFYENDEWKWAKMLYSIKYAVYKYYFELANDQKDNLNNYYDALFQLSAVSDTTTLNRIENIDISTLFYYNYALACTYFVIADLISNDTTNYINTYLIDFFKEKDILNYKDKEEILFLREYYKKIENDRANPKEIATHYYSMAYEIYSKQLYNLLETKDENIYWTANFLQDLAYFKNKLEQGKIDDYYKNYLFDSLPNVFIKLGDIDVEMYFRKSDVLFEKWGGSYIDYFQSCGSKFFLADYYYSLFLNERKENFLDSAKKYIQKAKNFNDSATLHRAFSFQHKMRYYELFHKIDSNAYKIEWCELNHQKKYNYANVKQNVENILKIKNENYEKQRKKGKMYIIISLFFVSAATMLIVIVYQIYIGKRIKKINSRLRQKYKEKDENEKIDNLQSLSECYETYIKYKKNPELIKELAKVVAHSVFGTTASNMILVLCFKDEDTGDLKGVSYDQNENKQLIDM